MKYQILLFLSIFLFSSCQKEQKPASEDFYYISKKLSYQKTNAGVRIKTERLDSFFSKEEIPLKKVAVLNASLIGYIAELGEEDKIVGVSSPEYIYSEKINDLIKKGKIETLGNEQKYNVEKIIALKPDVIFTNYIPTFENTYELLKKNGIKIIFLDEFLEQNPLEKSAYLKLFGVLLGAENKANTLYSKIEKRYEELRIKAQETKNKPLVICNELYGNQWFLPGGKTFAARYFKDAGAHYILQDNTENRSIPLSFEEIFMKSKNVKYWVNISNYDSKNNLSRINPAYEKLNVFNNGKLYTLGNRRKGKGNDYFESGVVRADLVLQDYIHIFHPNLLGNQEFTYMKELK